MNSEGANMNSTNYEMLKMIAEKLIISPKTVSIYCRRILEQLNMNNNYDLIHYVIDYKIKY